MMMVGGGDLQFNVGSEGRLGLGTYLIENGREMRAEIPNWIR